VDADGNAAELKISIHSGLRSLVLLAQFHGQTADVQEGTSKALLTEAFSTCGMAGSNPAAIAAGSPID
jgi:hypothetical protein